MAALLAFLKSKPIILGLVILTLLIPLSLIESKISERAQFHQRAVDEISRSWTHRQTLTGPILVVNYSTTKETTYWSEPDQKYLQHTQSLPETLMLPMKRVALTSDLTTEERYRGIHKVQVYNTRMHLDGDYDPDSFLELLGTEGFEQLHSAYLWIHVSDQRGFLDIPTLAWGDTHRTFSAGGHPHLDQQGIKVDLDQIALSEERSFSSELTLRGTYQMSFVPTGITTHIKMTSLWPHPKFIGRYLPTERLIDEGGKGFSAIWRITELATNISRDLTKCGQGNCMSLLNNHLGVELLTPVDIYLMTERAVKYSLLFVGLVFALLIAVEISRDVDVHPIQYLMIGVALSIFYLLLIALSEHIAFPFAYIIATLMCTGLLAFYGRHIFRGVLPGLNFGVLNALLFGLLYVVLNAEDVALLLGTLITFIIVTILMVVTSNTDRLAAFSARLQMKKES